MMFDLSDVDVELELVVRRPRRRSRPTTSIPLNVEDMLEPACEWPRRMATGTMPPMPPQVASGPTLGPDDVTLDATPVPIED